MATATLPELMIDAEKVVPDDFLYEVIDGQVVEKSNMGTYQSEVATILANYLGLFARERGLGRVINEVLVRIDQKTQYRPDCAFVSFEKWPRKRRTPNTQPWEIIPDLAIEVVSKTDQAVDVLAKVRHYFQAGVHRVWLVYPINEVIHLYDSFEEIRVLLRDDVLDGGDLFPGFQLPLVTIFEEFDEEDPAD